MGESFPFGPRRPFVLTADNHNSVNGIREFARSAGAPVRATPLEVPELTLDREAVETLLANPPGGHPGLFAFPAQSNYSGTQHPLSLVESARAAGWRVLVDTAAYVPSNSLNLDDVAADFVCVSFYKMFGLPTGVGALIARRDALAELRRPWFAGGTIAMVSVAADDHRLSAGHGGFEDGTLNFASIPAVTFGLDVLSEVGMETVHERVSSATAYLLGSFDSLLHSNGEPVIGVLGPAATGGAEGVNRGGTIAFNVFDPTGNMVKDRVVTEAAALEGISLRSGCFCNPGCGEAARSLTASDMAPFFERENTPGFCDLDDQMWARRGSGASALRASVGWVTDAADLRSLVDFLSGFVDRGAASWNEPGEASRNVGPDGP